VRTAQRADGGFVGAGSCARRASEKPLRFSLRRRAVQRVDATGATSASAAMISSIWSRNHGSMNVSAKISSTLMPARNASAT
jgi:hypothetical protein